MNKIQNVSLNTSKFFRKQGNILEIAISGTSREGLLMFIDKYISKIRGRKSDLASKRPLLITTPNPEQLVVAYKDKEFKKIIKKSDITLCDGIGLLAAYDFFEHSANNKQSESVYRNILNFLKSYLYILRYGRSSDGLTVIKGRDFIVDLLKIANENQYRVFLLGSTKVVLKRALRKLTELFPSVHFMIDEGAKLDSYSVPLNKNQRILDRKAVTKINKFKPDFLFVAFGAPKQEKWVYRNIDNLKTELIMVVGSSFEYIAGTRTRVPVIIDRMGMEWFWRILTGSQNIQRIINAVIKFPLLVLKET
jgi:N-acetylglucosaminyldiphosphoundecaprenol N-acetyl-beta-D-mannosaminyltransferase